MEAILYLLDPPAGTSQFDLLVTFEPTRPRVTYLLAAMTATQLHTHKTKQKQHTFYTQINTKTNAHMQTDTHSG